MISAACRPIANESRWRGKRQKRQTAIQTECALVTQSVGWQNGGGILLGRGNGDRMNERHEWVASVCCDGSDGRKRQKNGWHAHFVLVPLTIRCDRPTGNCQLLHIFQPPPNKNRSRGCMFFLAFFFWCQWRIHSGFLFFFIFSDRQSPNGLVKWAANHLR